MKKILIAVMIIVSALCLSGCGGPAPAQDNAYLKLLKEGDKALAEGNIEDALTAYMSALEMDPSAPQAPHRIFDTYVRDERFDDAIQFALDNYQSIATEMPEGSDVPYESEGSTYSGMTARQELAAFYSSAMDVSLPTCFRECRKPDSCSTKTWKNWRRISRNYTIWNVIPGYD